MIIPQDLGFFILSFIYFSCFNRRLDKVCGFRRLDAMCDCRYFNMVFIYMRMMQISKVYPINNKKSNQ